MVNYKQLFMKILKTIRVLAMFLTFASLHASGQGLHVSNGTSLFIKSGTTVSAGGLVLIPDADYSIAGVNTLTRTTTVTNPNPNTTIGRVYRFTPAAPAFSGSVGIRFLDAELNNLAKNNLTLNIFDGTNWNNQANVTRTENGNLVTASGLSNVILGELTLTAGTITPDLTLNPASFCTDDNNSYALGATPAGGVWSGSGVVQNADGTYSFRPSIAGPGNHQLTYTLPSDAGSASLTASVAASPNVYDVTGGGAYCTGDAGAPIGLNASDAGLTYQLIGPSGTVVATQTGTGGAISFGAFTLVGAYSVTTTSNGCPRTMNGSAVVSVSPAATSSVTAGGPTTFCPGGSLTLTANPGSSYLWSDGTTTQSITVTQGGTYSVTVTNSSGCEATSSPVSVTVEDTQAPVITFCPAPGGDAATIVRGSEACGYRIRASEFNTNASDDCNTPLVYSYTLRGATATGAPVTANSLSGVELNRGITQITWTVRDASGNSSSCSFAVEVKDQTAPVLHLPAEITLECTGASTYDNTGTATASDNCDQDVSITYSDEVIYEGMNGAVSNTYTINRTWVATDESGNSSSGLQRIRVVDTTPPTAPELSDITGQCSATVPSAPVAIDACGGFITGTTSNPLAYSSQGTHVVTWTFTDASGNTTTRTQRVVIRDNTAPVLQGYVAPNIAADCHAVPGAPQVLALDNCDPTPAVTLQETTTKGTDPNAREFYNYTITRTWTATDDAGNQAVIATQVVTVIDRYGPSISFNPRITRFADAGLCGAQLFVSKPSGADACSPVTITSNPAGAGNAYQFFPVGTTTIEWIATDVSGNSSKVTTVITVIDNQFPQGTAPLDVTVENDRGSCTASGVNLGTPSVTDNCSIRNISNNAPAVFPVGTTEVVWTVTDASGNTSYFRQHVTVQDTEKPVITAPADVHAAADASACSASGISLGTATASDNCTVANVTNDGPSVFPVGTTLVTWTVTDANGNTSTAIQRVVVSDNEKPSITAPAAVRASNDAGKCSASGLNLGTPVASDNCTVANVSNNAPTEFPVGTTIVTWTVTDAAGNSSTALQTVVVADTEKPTIAAPADLVIQTEPGTCLAPAQIFLGHPVTSDNCGPVTIGVGSPDGGKLTFNLGVTYVEWTAVDQAGNISSAIQKVTLIDMEKPKIMAPANIKVSNDAGNCSAVASLGTPSASDNCTLASVTNDAPALFPVGTTVVTWTATDAAGNSSTATQTVVVTDDEKPVVSCPSLPSSYCFNSNGYQLPQLTATDNCGIQSVVYTITGATNRSGSGYDPGSSFNVGTSVITWTVKDVHGNESNCQATVVVIDPMVVTIPDAKALPAGVAPNTVYTGYSPAASLTLTAQVSGGSGNYSFLWSNGATTQSITVSPSAATTYTVTVTDDKGCSKTASQQVQVVDVRCGNNLDKVLVCHVPEGNTSKQHNVCVSVSAVATHLASGDYLGVCGGQITQPVITDVKLVEFTVDAMPNPSISFFTLKLNSTSDLPIKMRVTDMWGRVLETRDNLTPGSTIELGSRYRAGAYFVELIQGLEWRHVKLIKTAN